MELGAALAHDDRAGRDHLAAERLDAEHLRLGIAAVACGTAALFLCHGSELLGVAATSAVDRADFQLGEVLAVAAVLLVVLAATHLEDAHLVVPTMRHDRGMDARAAHQGSSDFQVRAITDGQDLINHDFLANVRSNLFYLDLFAGRNFVLLATGFYDRVHMSPLQLFCSDAKNPCLPKEAVEPPI
jgi:hypothetical protein